MVFLPKLIGISRFITRKNIKQSPAEGHATKYLANTLQDAKVIKKQQQKNNKSLRNCYSQEEPKETWWLNVMCPT